MTHKTVKACQSCGASFEGEKDWHYCPKCAKAKRLDTVVKIRVCEDCGTEFYGGPRAKRCTICADIAKKESMRRHSKRGTMRPLGSMDKCAICGAMYSVQSGRQKYCSEACQRTGVLAWQREHKKGYEKASGQDEKKRKRREEQQKVCVYCQRTFRSTENKNTCSDYCKEAWKKLQQCKADINRGRIRNYKKYVDEMMAYRIGVNSSVTGTR